MKRRDFIAAASSMVTPLVLNGFGINTFARSSTIAQSIKRATNLGNDRVLVIIYLAGGNDGLNTVIPLEYYSKYMELRANIAIPEAKILKLGANPETGFHPAMEGMRRLYDDGKLAVVHSVSYPNPDLSHYRSTDIMMTGVDSSETSSSGWAGRYLEKAFPNYPVNYPNAEMEDPLAIQIGEISTPTLGGSSQPMGVTLQDPNTFYQLVGEFDPSSYGSNICCEAGALINFIKQKQTLAIGYGAQIKAAAEAGKNLAVYPDIFFKNELAEQLKIVARLIHGGLKSKIFYVGLGGFDTHANQVGIDSMDGIHYQLLKKLSDAISSFQNDLELLGLDQKVIGMTFSDFGRRASSNASKGTDHGIGAPMFVFGTGIKRQMIGMNPNLVNGLAPINSALGENNRDIKMQIDFRRVYMDILRDWFAIPGSTAQDILYRDFKTTSLFSESVQTVSSGSWPNPEIWSNGRVPSPRDIVQINSGHLVEVGQNIIARQIKVKPGGELKFLGDYSVSLNG